MTARQPDDQRMSVWRSPARGYVMLCAGALGVVLWVLLANGQSLVVVLAILAVGGVGLWTRMRLAPPLVLGLVAAGELLQRYGSSFPLDPELGLEFHASDVWLCGAVLGYVASHYRLQGLDRFLFLAENRDAQADRSGNGSARLTAAPWMPGRRSQTSVTPEEVGWLAISLPFWALAAQVLWHWLAQPREMLGWNWRVVQAMSFLGVLVAGLLIAALLLRHWRRRRMTPEEAELVLQDTLWNEMRGELRWFSRWLAWFWLRHKEKP
jgi:hypothetical protein